MYEFGKRIWSVLLVGAMCIGVIACAAKQESTEKLRDLEFSVIAQDNIPEELLGIIEEKKVSPFKLTFEDNGFIYICVGYGEQETGGYSIAVNELYETGNALYIDTNLIGPDAENKGKEAASYPYVVVKTEYMDKPVVFK